MRYSANNNEDDLERERKSLYELVAVYGLQHPLVVKQSEILDEIINRYNRMFLSRLKQSGTN
ncbi:Spo0E family sporulation regulatory protein-aspartic acid phosphatase [Paenibacillus taichungensis]|uniref:Spo0E family sporulation regulatory protein-aspartic acid phosphatase n=1 Tax=Paenibacillus taichungensis TaxID=484184 RepID=UPI0035DDB794